MRISTITGAAAFAAAALFLPATASAQAHHGGKKCPPGLAKKHNGCQPPGLARGDRIPDGYAYSRWDSIPERYRQRVRYDDRYRYVYRDNRLYAVDPQTRLIQAVVDLIR